MILIVPLIWTSGLLLLLIIVVSKIRVWGGTLRIPPMTHVLIRIILGIIGLRRSRVVVGGSEGGERKRDTGDLQIRVSIRV